MKKSKLLILIGIISISLSTSGCDSLRGFFNISKKSEGDYYSADTSTDTYYKYSSYNIYGIHYPNAVGDLNVLVIPVTIKGYEVNATEENRERIEKAYFGSEKDTGWESVASYYYTSSYGQLNITGTVTEWYECGKSMTELYDGSDSSLGSVSLLRDAVNWAVTTQGIDKTKYDTDNDGYMDAVMLIYSAPDFSHWDEYKEYYNNNMMDLFYEQFPEADLFWAFTYWDQRLDQRDFTWSGSNPYPHGYCFISYDFMDEASSDSDRSNDIEIDAHTFIHEFGHILGLDDYYDYDGIHSPLCGVDMMDLNVGDHNAFTKYALGWTTPYVVNNDCTITIGPESTTGDAIIVTPSSKNFNGSAFSEYFILELITTDGLWKQDSRHAYSNGVQAYTSYGIRIMHVDARLVNYYSGTFASSLNYTNYGQLDFYASNTPSRGYDYYNGKYSASSLKTDFISMIPATNSFSEFQTMNIYYASSDQLFKRGDYFDATSYNKFFNNGKMHDGSTFNYRITIDSCSSSSATISFKVK
ncbi:MAG: hypothetical protein LUB56_03220 [Coprobacillus sp.]|nr:hypothetical protein [Coprobacillus sp.]